MEKDKSKNFAGFFKGTIFGFLLCLALVSGYFYAPADSGLPEEISTENALQMLRNGEISEINFDESHLTLTDKNDEKFKTLFASEGARSLFIAAAEPTSTKITFEQSSKGLYKLILIQTIPYAFLFGSLLLLIIIYNKLIKGKVEK